MKIVPYNNKKEFFKILDGFCKKGNAKNDIAELVKDILAEVQKRGDAAVIEYTKKFDKSFLKAKDIKVQASEIEESRKKITPNDISAIKSAIREVKNFHKKTFPKSWTDFNNQGARIGERFYPINRVGLYIPGGNVPLVSTVIMTAVLAKLAGCPEIVVCSPPNSNGEISKAILAALSLVGVTEIYKIGGIQAIAAMTYGTKTIKPVDKIYGPGNAYVMEAKRQVIGLVGIDLLPGPSELMIIADGNANPDWVAADLLAQAEHGSGKELLYMVSTSKTFLNKLKKSLSKALGQIKHEKKCLKIISERTFYVSCNNIKEATIIANYVAPEHLELQVADNLISSLTKEIKTAGAILQGYNTPTALGDFTAGPSHTLPTGRTGRFDSGLQLIDFMRRTSILRYNKKSLEKASPIVKTFANLEQLDAHGRSVEIRLD